MSTFHWYITGRLRIERLKAWIVAYKRAIFADFLWEILLWFWNKHRSSICADIATIERRQFTGPKEPGGKVGEEAAKIQCLSTRWSLISARAAISNSATQVWPSLSLPPYPFCIPLVPYRHQLFESARNTLPWNTEFYRVTIHKHYLATTPWCQGIPEIIDFRLIRASIWNEMARLNLNFWAPVQTHKTVAVELELDDHDAARFMTVGQSLGFRHWRAGLQDARVRGQGDSGVEFRSFGGLPSNQRHVWGGCWWTKKKT